MADKDVQDQQRKAAQEQAAADAERGGKRLDETVPGGKYLLDDGVTLVTADGKPYTGAKGG